MLVPDSTLPLASWPQYALTALPAVTYFAVAKRAAELAVIAASASATSSLAVALMSVGVCAWRVPRGVRHGQVPATLPNRR